MNITKEFLDGLNLVSLFFTQGKNDINCVLERSEKGVLFFNFTGDFKFAEGERLPLSATFQKEAELTVSKAGFKILESGLDWILGTVENCEHDLREVLERISFLESQYEKYGRRKEMRVKIGKENFLAFGLSSPEQKLFSKAAKIIQPCAIVDASIHGICIVTPFENPLFKSIDNFNVHISFVNPEQVVLLQAHKVLLRLDNANGRTFATISCQLLEPIHYAWKERVINLLEKHS